MRREKRWRYFCDFCRKSGASGGHMRRHEERCTRNPNRVCGMCAEAELEQRPMAELVAALIEGGVEAVSRVASGCPVCIMAAIMVHRRDEPLTYEPGPYTDYCSNFIEFDYRAAVKAFREGLGVEAYL